MKLFVLSYASFSCNDYQIFSDTIGVYTTKEDAFRAMKHNVELDISDGDNVEDWGVSDLDAEYRNDFSDDYKTYHIKEINV